MAPPRSGCQALFPVGVTDLGAHQQTEAAAPAGRNPYFLMFFYNNVLSAFQVIGNAGKAENLDQWRRSHGPHGLTCRKIKL